MRYYEQLMNVETEIIQLDTIRALLNALATGSENMYLENIRSCIFFIEDQLESASEKIDNSFYELFDAIRADSQEELKPKQNFEPLQDVVRQWAETVEES